MRTSDRPIVKRGAACLGASFREGRKIMKFQVFPGIWPFCTASWSRGLVGSAAACDDGGYRQGGGDGLPIGWAAGRGPAGTAAPAAGASMGPDEGRGGTGASERRAATRLPVAYTRESHGADRRGLLAPLRRN